MPTQLNGVSVTVNGKPAYVYFHYRAAISSVCKSDQSNVLTSLDATQGPVQIKVTSGGPPTPMEAWSGPRNCIRVSPHPHNPAKPL